MTIESARQGPVTDWKLRNLNHLRFLFALSVALSHALAILDPDGFILARTILNSDASVQGFFILSGGLVVASFERNPDTRAFYTRRLARIFPAYLLAVLVFALAGIASAYLHGRSVGIADVAGYFAANFATLNFLHPQIDGVFADNPLTVINGALWSIKVELMFYVAVPLVVWLIKRIGLWPVLVAMILCGTLWWPMVEYASSAYGRLPPESLRYQLPGQLHYFAIGIGLFQFGRRRQPMSMIALVIMAEALFLFTGGIDMLGRTTVLTALIMGATMLPQMPGPTKDGDDISYGLYLVHFPLAQLLLENGVASSTPILFAVLVAFGSLAWGMFSWRTVERPALDWVAKRRA